MRQPTDSQIFNHMVPEEDCCGRCGGDVEKVQYPDYNTQKCLECDFEPMPPEEE